MSQQTGTKTNSMQSQNKADSLSRDRSSCQRNWNKTKLVVITTKPHFQKSKIYWNLLFFHGSVLVRGDVSEYQKDLRNINGKSPFPPSLITQHSRHEFVSTIYVMSRSGYMSMSQLSQVEGSGVACHLGNDSRQAEDHCSGPGHFSNRWNILQLCLWRLKPIFSSRQNMIFP